MTYEKLLDDAIAAMGAFHSALEPVDDERQGAAVSGDAVRIFVDAHARLLYARKQLKDRQAKEDAVIPAMNSCTHCGAIHAPGGNTLCSQ